MSKAQLYRTSVSLQTGQLNEYTERKEMPSEAVCMALANVPTGEQRSRFLAVGLADNTVRIISLDPSVSFSSLLLIAGCDTTAF
jgi:splicing factor 3B subunit 3